MRKILLLAASVTAVAVTAFATAGAAAIPDRLTIVTEDGRALQLERS